jgi:serine beta-lactamase-like protein LACTB, mitochondrial
MLKVVAAIPLSLLAIVTLGAARLPDQMPSAATLGSTDAAEHTTYETGSTSPASKGVRWPGLSCAIAAHGELVWARGLGYADLEQHVPVTPATKFRIGSVSKTLTAVGAALLWQQGKLDIDAPIQRYVPSFPNKGYVVTVRELGGMLGGIRGYSQSDFGDLPDNQEHYASTLAGLAIFENDPLAAPPRTKFIYSSYGFNLIGAAIAGASGQSYLAFLHDHVLVPLGMLHTIADDPLEVIADRAHGYDRSSTGIWRNAEYIDSSYKWPSGGMLSTPSDLVRFGSALLRPGFLDARSLALLFTAQHALTPAGDVGDQEPYAFGWMVPTLDAGFGLEPIIYHSGSIEGFHAMLVIYPNDGIVAACAVNASDLGFTKAQVRAIAAPIIDWSRSRRAARP